MNSPASLSLAEYCQQVARQAKQAGQLLLQVDSEAKNRWLCAVADDLQSASGEIAAANQRDVDAANQAGLTAAQIDRLSLNHHRITSIASGLKQVAALADPVGELIEQRLRPNGIQINKLRVPLGVIFFIYESRPNVTADAAAICVKSGNAVILRGGKEAAHSNKLIADKLRGRLREFGLPLNAVQLVETTERDAVDEFLKLSEWIDLAIPRGGESLIRRVVESSKVPVMKHFTGNCHVYIDKSADLDLALSVILNAKCQRPGVCNACESLLIHRDIAAAFVPQICAALIERGVEVRGDSQCRELAEGVNNATEEDWSKEYLDLVISVAITESVESAIQHINRYGSHHTDAIIAQDASAIQLFSKLVDSAALMVNASTRFHDGGEFGLGAEIGISTDKFHARGPCGLRELTSYKYVCVGNGQIRE